MRSRSFAFSFFSLILFAAAAVGLQASEPAAVSETAPAATAPASDVSAEIEDVSKRPLKVAIYSKSMKKKRLAAIIETDELFECIPVSAADIRNGILDKCDFVLLPGGSARAQAKDMQPEGVEKLKKFVHEGNGYLGVCAGAYFPIHQGFLNGNTKSPKWARGIEQLDLELSEEGIAIFGEEYRGMQKVRYANGPVFDVNIDPDMPQVDILAWFRSEVALNGTPAGIQVNSPAMARTTYGKGMVITFSPHPEDSETLKYFFPKALRYMAGKLNKIPQTETNAETNAESQTETAADAH